jgi:hypothetical protein
VCVVPEDDVGYLGRGLTFNDQPIRWTLKAGAKHMGYRIIHITDQGSDCFNWPFQIGQRVRSKTSELSEAVIDAWAEGDMPEGEAPNFVADAEMFYRVRIEDGREFMERSTGLEAEPGLTLL